MSERPAVSVVMVTYNAREWTERALRALAEHTELRHELIVVDNASTDGTRELLAGHGDARVVLNDENRGFGAANNQGAALASAPLVLFVNSDVIVSPGWCTPLVETLEDVRVGVVGPRLLNLDGSLQAAGALLARSGSTTVYGYGDDPDDPEYTFRREVDYLSGACLLVRRAAFDDIGGFDLVYGLGYFEDADLCLSLRAHGYRVVYEPRSRVTHALGASGGGEPLAALALRNRDVFRRRWQRVLASRPLSPLHASRRRLLAARDAVATNRILLIADGSDSAVPRLVHALAPWAQSARVTVLALDETAVSVDANIELVPRQREVENWLQERRFHYDVVIAASEDERLDPLLTRTQPTAVRIDREAISPQALAAAGVAPPRGAGSPL